MVFGYVLPINKYIYLIYPTYYMGCYDNKRIYVIYTLNYNVYHNDAHCSALLESQLYLDIIYNIIRIILYLHIIYYL